MANHLHWYQRAPKAALEGMAVLTLGERGAYTTILDLIYCHDGCVDDDDRFIAGWLRCDVRVWKRIRARLIKLGKLYVHAGTLGNERADRVVDEALHRVASARHAGLISAAKRGASLKVLKDLASTPVERAFNLLTSTPTKSLSSFTNLTVGGKAGNRGRNLRTPHGPSLKRFTARRKRGTHDRSGPNERQSEILARSPRSGCTGVYGA